MYRYRQQQNNHLVIKFWFYVRNFSNLPKLLDLHTIVHKQKSKNYSFGGYHVSMHLANFVLTIFIRYLGKNNVYIIYISIYIDIFIYLSIYESQILNFAHPYCNLFSEN